MVFIHPPTCWTSAVSTSRLLGGGSLRCPLLHPTSLSVPDYNHTGPGFFLLPPSQAQRGDGGLAKLTLKPQYSFPFHSFHPGHLGYTGVGRSCISLLQAVNFPSSTRVSLGLCQGLSHRYPWPGYTGHCSSRQERLSGLLMASCSTGHVGSYFSKSTESAQDPV